MITFADMKQIIVCIIVIITFAGCQFKDSGGDADNAARKHFTTDIMLKTTPVKDQGHGDLCWAYAMLATIETEHLMQGDSVNLSADFVARKLIEEEANERFLTGHGRIATRGVAPMLIHLIETYGLNHYDAFHADSATDYRVIERKVGQIAVAEKNYDRFHERLNAILDRDIHAVIPRVYMLGAVYTPLEFAHSVCGQDEYIAYTSFTHHPFGSSFALEIPDNRYHQPFMNIPIDSLMSSVVQSLRHGHPVCWEGDISEPGFSFQQGIAELEETIDGDGQRQRQLSFEHKTTTDDHCMEIVGMAHDDGGHQYFIMKNSWGQDNPYHGFMFVSADYVRMKTIAVVIKERD